MSAHLFVGVESEVWREPCPRYVELSSAAMDAKKEGVGSTPWQGDQSSTGVTLDASASTPGNRQLVRLCGIDIPLGGKIRILGVRQMLLIGQSLSGDSGGTYVFEREVVSPNWCFVDGNVSWHVRHEPNQFSQWEVADAAQVGGTSPALSGEDSSLLYVPPFAPYVAPGAGIPPGAEVDYLGTWRDMRYPWTTTQWDLSVPVLGPGRVMFYASVKQTDPETRVEIPAMVAPAPFTDPVVCGLRPEDQFLIQFPNAVYTRVAGALLVEVFPCCGPMKQTSNRCLTCGGANCERHR